MVQRRLGLWLVFMSSLLVHVPAEAGAEWVALEAHHQSHPLKTVYIDPHIVRRGGTVVEISALIDWKEMQGGRSPTRFYSTKVTKQFDCAEKRVRTLTATDYYGHMGTGEVIGGGHTGEDQWMAIEPGTINQGLWEAACGKRR